MCCVQIWPFGQAAALDDMRPKRLRNHGGFGSLAIASGGGRGMGFVL